MTDGMIEERKKGAWKNVLGAREEIVRENVLDI